MRMSARIDAVAARVQTAATQKRVTGSMQGVVKAMETAMKTMNLEKVQTLMDRFEKDFENLDVQSATMEVPIYIFNGNKIKLKGSMSGMYYILLSSLSYQMLPFNK